MISVQLSSQTKGKAELNLTLRDGDIITGTSKITSVELKTDYGKLVIPIKNVSSIEVGIPPDDANKDKICQLITNLSNGMEDVRSEAYNDLTGMGAGAIPIISEFIYSEKYQPSEYTDYTPEGVISELKALHNVDEASSEEDIITIDYMYNMGGAYAFTKIDLKTEYGELSIPKSKIKKIEVMYHVAGSGSERTFKLMASKHISANQSGGWLNTGIMVKSGQQINISAFGEITFASLSGSKYKPNGQTSGGNVDDYNYGTENNTATAYPTYGNVVYKIGESGQSMRAGDKFSGKAKASGMLLLSIYETVFNAANSGFYTVKLSVK